MHCILGHLSVTASIRYFSSLLFSSDHTTWNLRHPEPWCGQFTVCSLGHVWLVLTTAHQEQLSCCLLRILCPSCLAVHSSCLVKVLWMLMLPISPASNRPTLRNDCLLPVSTSHSLKGVTVLRGSPVNNFFCCSSLIYVKMHYIALYEPVDTCSIFRCSADRLRSDWMTTLLICP